MSGRPTYRAQVGDALDLLYGALQPYVARRMQEAYGDAWLEKARGTLHGKPPARWDTSDLLALIYKHFFPAFRGLGHEGRSRVSLLREVRKRWAHQVDLSLDETRRTLETAVLLLRGIGADAEADRLEPYVLELMQRELQQRGPTSSSAGVEASRPDADRFDLLSRLRRLRPLGDRERSEPLELRRDLLDEVERAVEPHRASTTSYDRIMLHLLVPDGRTRALFEAALEGQEESFRQAVLRRLSDARLSVPKGLRISWKYHPTSPARLAGKLAERPFYAELGRRSTATSATLTVLVGRASRGGYRIRETAPVLIGRQQRVLDERGRLIRRNTVAFRDYEDDRLSDEERRTHRTVSRRHACIRYDAAAGAFCLTDEGSTCGTSVVRQGYPVPIQVKGHPVALQDGDLLYFGRACVRFNTSASA